MNEISAPAVMRSNTIDILRALTMILMIFVNDLWSLSGIPEWLGHVERGIDGIGLADTVFPAFLFIVGLSLPFSLDSRRNKGATDLQLVQHILARTLALIVMGVFLVNGESINEAATGLSRRVWNPLCCLCFIMIWNNYSKSINPTVVKCLKAVGIIILICLAYIYRGGSDNQILRFAQHWWGILGLIGWSYLAAGLITLFAKNNFYVIAFAWTFFVILSMLHHAEMMPSFFKIIPDPIRGGTLTGLALGGVLTSTIFRSFKDRKDDKSIFIVLLLCTASLVILTYITRPYWGIAKLGATPAWLFICSAFTILAFISLYWLVDLKGKSNWFTFIKPAGTDSLLCYLMPYFLYALIQLLGIVLPDILLTGGIGLVKSLLFAFLCVWMTRVLNHWGVRLKL